MRCLSALIILLALGGPGCQPDAPAGVEPAWGVGSKADDGRCSPSDDLCWTTLESQQMKGALGLLRKTSLGEMDPAVTLDQVLPVVHDLWHKLLDEERAALLDIETKLASLAPMDALMRLETEVLDRPASLYYAAYLALAGRRADLEASGSSAKADDGASGSYETFWGVEVTEDMAECLAIMKESCVLGHGYALLLELSGVLEVDYEVLDRETFFRHDLATGQELPHGRSRYERSESVILKYGLYAGGTGVAVGLIRMIPVAGIPLAIATEVCTLFPLHSRMVFEIAAVYGVDIRERRNLLTATLVVVNGELNHEAVDMLAASSISDIFEDAIEDRMQLTGLVYVGGFVTAVATKKLIRFLTHRSRQAVTNAAAGETARHTGSQVLGYVTLGLSVVAAGIADWYITDKIGERAALSIRRWLVDLTMDGTPYLASVEHRACGFQVLGAMAWADGRVAERERRLFIAMLAKPYYLGDRRWYRLTPSERLERAGDLAAIAGQVDDAEDESLECSEDSFEGLPARQKVELLSLVFAMKKIDLDDNAREEIFYQRLRDVLDGRSWFFDGPKIPEEHLHFVERFIHMLLHPTLINDLSDRNIPELDLLEPEDTLDFLRHPDPAATADFRCGFEGSCP